MRTHQKIDARTLDMHRLVAEKIRRDPALFEEAKEILARWRTFVHPNSQPYLMEWERLMEQGIDACLAVALEESEHATALRQSSPLTCVLPNEERLIFLAQWNARQRGEGYKNGTLSLLEEAIFQQDFRAMEKRLAVWLMAHGEPSEASGLMERLPEDKARIFAGFLQWAAHGDWIPLSSVEPALAVARGRGLYDPTKLDIFERWGTDWRFDWHRMWQCQWEMVWRPPASERKPTPGLLYTTCGGIAVTLNPEVNARAGCTAGIFGLA